MEQRNLILAIVASLAILLGFELLYNIPRQRELQEVQQAEQVEGAQQAERAEPAGEAARPGDGEGTLGEPAEVPGTAPAAAGAPRRAQVLERSPRVAVRTPAVEGSISLVGGRIDDLTLRNYRQSRAGDSAKIDLLSPPGSASAYFADFGWAPSGGGVTVPGSQTRWQADGEVLTPDQPVTLTWTSPEGITFERTFALDEHFMFTVTQRAVNDSGREVRLAPYGLISRRGTPDVLGFYILHEGPLGVFQGTLEELDYSDLSDDGPQHFESAGGWLGITDKYWLVALIPEQQRKMKARFLHDASAGVAKYQSDYLHEPRTLAPGASLEQTSRLFAGAKEVALLDRYREQLGIPHFDKAVDFGWFYFLTKPIFEVLHFFAQMTGNFGVAILILVVIIKILFFPLANKSYRSMAKMRAVQPEMQRLRERFGEDKQRLNQEMMALYKREGANPLSGCLPILVQIPVFFALYKVLFVTIEMRHAPFFAWIQDLSAKDPTSWVNLFGILPWSVPSLGPLDVVNIGALPLFMGLSMFAQQRLNPQPADQMQARLFLLMPVVFTFLLAQFPAGLVLYWSWNNLLSILQQYVIMRRHGTSIGGQQPTPPVKAGPAEAGGSAGAARAPEADEAAAEEDEQKESEAREPALAEAEVEPGGRPAKAKGKAGGGQPAKATAGGGKARKGKSGGKSRAGKSRGGKARGKGAKKR